jgi:phosphoglycolate phosphatase-like HAD superfamily hydrolase
VKLVLFDIDGTILWSDGAGRRAMTAALTHVFGGAGPTDYHYDGKTDPQIVRDLMRAAGHTDELIDARMSHLMER